MVRFDVARKIYMFFIKCNVKIALFKTMAIAIDRYVVVIVSCIYIWNYHIKLSYVTHVNPYSDRRRDSNLENDGITMITSIRPRDAANETKNHGSDRGQYQSK
ncbi:hypothetical protein MAR_005149 [Mya arenaria]|uniref:Uncharacterized protein n=1 Tax=Mya arenaria TaxID=6604 RepID=A0ABY7F117_MYAAR|nr:hypothetical protein MAR_005149 [Mya arenaria]